MSSQFYSNSNKGHQKHQLVFDMQPSLHLNFFFAAESQRNLAI